MLPQQLHDSLLARLQRSQRAHTSLRGRRRSIEGAPLVWQDTFANLRRIHATVKPLQPIKGPPTKLQRHSAVALMDRHRGHRTARTAYPRASNTRIILRTAAQALQCYHPPHEPRPGPRPQLPGQSVRRRARRTSGAPWTPSSPIGVQRCLCWTNSSSAAVKRHLRCSQSGSTAVKHYLR